MKYSMLFMTRDGKTLPFSDGKEPRPFDLEELLIRFLVHFVNDADCYIISIIIKGEQKRHFIGQNEKGRIGMIDADSKEIYSPKQFMAELRSLDISKSNTSKFPSEFFQICKN